MNLYKYCNGFEMAFVSIPKRVLEALNPVCHYPLTSKGLFQSLKGFWRLWIWLGLAIIPSHREFQSLKGFWRLWIAWYRLDKGLYAFVSIPKRVLEALNPYEKENVGCSSLVSIPKRVLEALNRFPLVLDTIRQIVSIPKRVLEALNLYLGKPCRLHLMFQSLKGFWRLWIKCLNAIVITSELSFQSLKGFWRLWIITGSATHWGAWDALFQSLKGFWRLWIVDLAIPKPSLAKFQSLKGFWRLWIRDRLCWQCSWCCCFNP